MCPVNPKQASDWHTERLGNPVNPILFLALGSAVTVCTACAGLRDAREVPAFLGPVSPVLKDGTIYSPVGRDSHGCVLYSVRIPDGRAPAALMYRSIEGRFS